MAYIFDDSHISICTKIESQPIFDVINYSLAFVYAAQLIFNLYCIIVACKYNGKSRMKKYGSYGSYGIERNSIISTTTPGTIYSENELKNPSRKQLYEYVFHCLIIAGCLELFTSCYNR